MHMTEVANENGMPISSGAWLAVTLVTYGLDTVRQLLAERTVGRLYITETKKKAPTGAFFYRN
jgi:hypothetical protein